jgi:hypothetical protein
MNLHNAQVSAGLPVRPGAGDGDKAGAVRGHAPEEAGARAHVAGAAVSARTDLYEHRVLVAINADFSDMLFVA